MTQESKILLKPFINQEEMRTFFSSSQNERFFYLTFMDISISSIKAMIPYISINGFLCFWNSSIIQVILYRKGKGFFFINIKKTVRLRPSSLIFSGIYLWSFDFFLEQFAIFKNLRIRNMKINELFNFELHKPKCSFFNKKTFILIFY